MKKADSTPVVSKQVVYCGPTISKMGIVQFAVFKGGYPANVSAAIAEYPDIEKLMVPIEELGEFRMQIAKAGSEPHRLFHQVRNDMKGGMK